MTLRIGLHFVTVLLCALAAVTMSLTYLFAILSDEQDKFTLASFYISSAWRVELSRVIGNTGIPLTSVMIALAVSAKYLSLRELTAKGSDVLLTALYTGVASSVLLMASCSITDAYELTHFTLAGLCFFSSYTCMYCFHLFESQRGTRTLSFVFKRVIFCLGFLSGCVLFFVCVVADTPHRNVIGSVAELSVAFCIFATVITFGFELSDYELHLTLSPRS